MNSGDNLDKVTREVAEDSCPHLECAAKVEVSKLADNDGGGMATHQAHIEIVCVDCGVEFHFVGADQGQSFRRPMASAKAKTLIAPIHPGPGPSMHYQTFEVPQVAIDEAAELESKEQNGTEQNS